MINHFILLLLMIQRKYILKFQKKLILKIVINLFHYYQQIIIKEKFHIKKSIINQEI